MLIFVPDHWQSLLEKSACQWKMKWIFHLTYFSISTPVLHTLALTASSSSSLLPWTLMTYCITSAAFPFHINQYWGFILYSKPEFHQTCHHLVPFLHFWWWGWFLTVGSISVSSLLMSVIRTETQQLLLTEGRIVLQIESQSFQFQIDCLDFLNKNSTRMSLFQLPPLF